MLSKRLIGIITVAVIFFAALGIYFTVNNEEETPTVEPTNQQQNFDFVKEDVSKTDSSQYFESFGVGKLKVITYGGFRSVKTAVQGNREFALIRNPEEVGGLELVISNEQGDYYFAEDFMGEKIPYPDGEPESVFGYDQTGLVSGKIIRDRISSAEYYASYPTADLAKQSGFTVIGDNGASDRYLKSKYLRITNLNNNRQVIVEIDDRNPIEGTMYISEATRRALMVDEGSLGSFGLEIIEKENNSLGLVRR